MDSKAEYRARIALMKRDRAEPEIREKVERLLRSLGFDMYRCTLMHEQIAKQAKIDPPAGDQLVDDWIHNLRADEAKRLVFALRDRMD